VSIRQARNRAEFRRAPTKTARYPL